MFLCLLFRPFPAAFCPFLLFLKLLLIISHSLTKDPAKLPIVIEFADQQGVGVFARTLAQKLAAQPGKPHAPRRRRSPRSLDEEDAMDASMEAAIRDELAGGESGARQ
mgnify:CR=1 FL=1